MAEVEARSKQETLDLFDMYTAAYPKAYFSVWNSRQIKFPFLENDPSLMRSFLEDNLNSLEQTGTVTIYTLKFHPRLEKDGFITDKTPVLASYHFRVTQPVPLSSRDLVQTNNNDNLRREIEELKQLIVQQKVNNEILPDDEAESEDLLIGRTESLNKAIGSANSFVSGIKELLQELKSPETMNLIGNVFGKGNQNNMSAKTIGNVDVPQFANDEEKVRYAIRLLDKNVPNFPDALLKLAKLSVEDPGKLKMALNFL